MQKEIVYGYIYYHKFYQISIIKFSNKYLTKYTLRTESESVLRMRDALDLWVLHGTRRDSKEKVRNREYFFYLKLKPDIKDVCHTQKRKWKLLSTYFKRP